jgi:hypothetical protein
MLSFVMADVMTSHKIHVGASVITKYFIFKVVQASAPRVCQSITIGNKAPLVVHRTHRLTYLSPRKPRTDGLPTVKAAVPTAPT